MKAIGWGRVRGGLRRAALLWCVGGMVSLAGAQSIGQFGGGAPAGVVGPSQRSVAEWLARLQQGARVPSYIGTFVVSSASGAMSSSRIWHVCEGDVQLERVDALTGVPRSTLRRNDTVMTFLPDARVVTLDQRQLGAVFPNLLNLAQGLPVADYYDARELWRGRVAGCDAEIVQLLPRDGILVSCSCSHHLAQDELIGAIQQSARHLNRFAQVVEVGGHGPDHPIHPAIPETRYLKAIFCRVVQE